MNHPPQYTPKLRDSSTERKVIIAVIIGMVFLVVGGVVSIAGILIVTANVRVVYTAEDVPPHKVDLLLEKEILFPDEELLALFSAQSLMEDFSGSLITDGYAIYFEEQLFTRELTIWQVPLAEVTEIHEPDRFLIYPLLQVDGVDGEMVTLDIPYSRDEADRFMAILEEAVANARENARWETPIKH